MKFGIGTFKTRDGRTVTITRDDAIFSPTDPYGLLGLVDGDEEYWASNGRFHLNQEDPLDLVGPAEPERATEPPSHLATLKAALDGLASAVAERASKRVIFNHAADAAWEANRRATKAQMEFNHALATFTKAVGELSK